MTEALGGWGRRAVQGRDGLRLVPRRSLHVTLCFLGSRSADELGPIAAVLRACAAPVPALRVAGPAWLPPQRPGVLAVDLADADGACAAVQGALSRALSELGVYEPDRRRFRPHVTVARVRRGAQAGDARLPDLPDVGTFAGSALTLFWSRPGRGPAHYEALERGSLRCPSADGASS